ncbi:hypothetical protein SCP_0312490 [Sparassis crispa]|uniref:Uncharacterized protein n=1 Tax=Sparassis crispa TaxID=139825 RepID=A0A401GH61_9APHY|nr:hypothetical protein SCP_0312490 [Sparassis crispa]GBE81520.1 hypothetical protein SCP_0312490 [Sparassis crispa]
MPVMKGAGRAQPCYCKTFNCQGQFRDWNMLHAHQRADRRRKKTSSVLEGDELADQIFELTLKDALTDEPTTESALLPPPPPPARHPSSTVPSSQPTVSPLPPIPPPLTSLPGLWIVDYEI